MSRWRSRPERYGRTRAGASAVPLRPRAPLSTGGPTTVGWPRSRGLGIATGRRLDRRAAAPENGPTVTRRWFPDVLDSEGQLRGDLLVRADVPVQSVLRSRRNVR